MKGHESFSGSSAGEQQEKQGGKVEKFLSKIKGFKEKIAQKLGLKGEKLTEATDEALVDAAREVISEADEDGMRTDEEREEIRDAVSSVVVQGAMEQAGYEQSAGENPILSLDNDETEAELVDSIATLHEEEATLPTGEDVAELAVQAIEAAKWDHMEKVGGQQGSNEGGWYENPSTGERYYVKFYENPSQGRVEYVANAVYAKLGIKAVRSEIVQMDGREAIASPAVEGAESTSMQQQRSSEDVRKGFVADAFLANWDVVGLVHDNIVRGADGGMYRIDNGGSLIFRAQGGDKHYSPDGIPELDTMRNPNYPAGQVFGEISQEEIIEQARALLDNLSEEDIREIVDQSGLEGEERERVLEGMLGRRRFLEKMVADADAKASSGDIWDDDDGSGGGTSEGGTAEIGTWNPDDYDFDDESVWDDEPTPQPDPEPTPEPDPWGEPEPDPWGHPDPDPWGDPEPDPWGDPIPPTEQGQSEDELQSWLDGLGKLPPMEESVSPPSDSTYDSFGSYPEVAPYCEDDPEPDEELDDGGEQEPLPKPRLGEVIRTLQSKESERSGEYMVFPRAEITCDYDHIEGQRVEVYDKEASGRIELSFKLRSGHKELYDRIIQRQDTSMDRISFTYKSGESYGVHDYCGSISFERNGVKVSIADPDPNVRTSQGLIVIEIPGDMDPDEAERIVSEIMEQDLAIQGGLDEPPEFAEEQYKEARYRWEHKVTGEMAPWQTERARRMRREEVAPGYSTYVEPGKHREYERRYGEARAIHWVSSQDPEMIASLLVNGLLCTSERYNRGIMQDGMSSEEDLRTGGGNSVFVRIMKKDEAHQTRNAGGAVIVFKPEVFDRSDWYAYNSDRFGNTSEAVMRERISPDEAFKRMQNDQLAGNNELMFRTGIAPRHIECIRVVPSLRERVLSTLRAQGVTEIDGRPIEEIVVSTDPEPVEAQQEWWETPEIPPDPSIEQLPEQSEGGTATQWLYDKESTPSEKEQIRDAFINGEIAYSDIGTLFDICDDVDQFIVLCDSFIANGGDTGKLATDLSMFIIKECTEEDIQGYIDGTSDNDELNTMLDYMVANFNTDVHNMLKLKQTWYQ